MPNFESFKQYGELEKQRQQDQSRPDSVSNEPKKPSLLSKLRGKAEPKP